MPHSSSSVCEPHPTGSVPVLLDPHNATPRTRTPWGGTTLANTFKKSAHWREGQILGEVWELSVEPSFPSRIATPGVAQDTHTTLASAIQDAPEAWLGTQHNRTSTHGLTLLVKSIDAADNLSVQVHPQHDDPALASDESGKSEAWLILHAAPDAGLYMGWRTGVTREDVADCIARAARLDTLMNFISVSPGQVFYIPAGTPHAIGRGVVLCEVQHVVPGKRAVTYRYWDWNRRYNASGLQDPQGSPRTLHVERALMCTRWDAPRGEECVRSAQTAHVDLDTYTHKGTRSHTLVSCPWFEATLLQGTSHTTQSLHTQGRFLALFVLEGHVQLSTPHVERTVPMGSCVAIPAHVEDIQLHLERANVVLFRPTTHHTAS